MTVHFGDGSSITTGASDAGIPTGAIILWSGAANAIPSGFVLCNGSNNTPDLRGRFVVGYNDNDNDYDVNDTGGSKDNTLSVSQLPSHDHSFTTGNPNTTLTGTVQKIAETYAGAGTASGIFTKLGSQNAPLTPSGVDSSPTGGFSIDATHTHSGTTGGTGSGSAIENRPPYYALCYIMKT